MRLGILAPQASQRTALEEDCGANSRPIMYGKTLNVEDGRQGLHGSYRLFFRDIGGRIFGGFSLEIFMIVLIGERPTRR